MNSIKHFINKNYMTSKIEIILNLNFDKNINRLVYKKLKTYNEAYLMFEMYKSYLIIRYLYENIHLPPPGIVDDAWHDHILDTEKYFNDINSIFGYYLHHYPYHGINGEEIGPLEQRDGYKLIDIYYKKIFNCNSYTLYTQLRRKLDMKYPKNEIITVINYLQDNKSTENEILRKQLATFLAEQEILSENNKAKPNYQELERKQPYIEKNNNSDNSDDSDDSGWHGNTCG